MVYFSWKLSSSIVTLNRILLKCFHHTSWKAWHFIHVFIYTHIYSCHLPVTWRCHKAVLLPFHYTLTFYCNCIASHPLVSNCSAATLELYCLGNRIKIFLCGRISPTLSLSLPLATPVLTILASLSVGNRPNGSPCWVFPLALLKRLLAHISVYNAISWFHPTMGFLIPSTCII